MKTEIHKKESLSTVEIISQEILIKKPEDGKDLFADFYYQGYEGIVFHGRNISDAFYDLKTGIAGEILQHATNFRVRIGIIGDFDKFKSESLKAFIRESNRKGKYVFKPTLSEIMEPLLYK